MNVNVNVIVLPFVSEGDGGEDGRDEGDVVQRVDQEREQVHKGHT